MEPNEHDLLIRIDERVGAMGIQMTALQNSVSARLHKQDMKIDTLPGWRHVALGGGSLVLAVGGWVAKTFLHANG